ncbi:MAG: PDZ domain-containing protein, partial [Firmicutes bacterium]|nr:PDZ domain-containing protein [Bacillota bacterium]
TSSDLLVGQTVVAIGNPLGQLGGTVTQGIISALDRSITIDGQTMTLLQIDAAINPGNSGGGLFNAQGNLIGIVNAKSTGSEIDGIGFAIPIDNVMNVIDDLKTHGYVTGRVAIGISMIDINSDQMAWMYRVNELGVYVYRVTANSPAAQGGLTSGDRIISINGTQVSNSTECKAAIQSTSVGDTITIVVSRNGQEVTLSVIAGEYIPEGVPTPTGAEDLDPAA